jgi:hypothetical protein
MICFTCVVLVGLLYPQTGLTTQDEPTIKEAVKPAIEAGVEFLRRQQTNQGIWAFQGSTTPGSEQVVGATALCGIALMECNVPANDKQIQAAYKVVKAAANDPKFTYTYSVCLAVLFLDRYHRGKLNTHADAGTIVRLGLMIANGQSDSRWGYNLPSGAVDNSNTQFSVVALWIAKKYCKPGSTNLSIITRALYNTEKKMRASQTSDGAWTYDPSGISMAPKTTGSMTCAGILGIALSAGLRAEQKQLAAFRGAGGTDDGGDVVNFLEKDPAIQAAKTYLVKSISQFTTGLPQEAHVTYFLWSLERVATLYKWKKSNFGNVDWFEIGARYLMSKQQQNGGWSLDFLSGPTVDTAFSLLFLAKSNLLGDLQQAEFKFDKMGGDVVPKKKETAPKTETAQEKAKELLEKLLTALPDKQAEILADLTEGKGGDYSAALVEAIQKLSTNAAKDAAREALANRFRRLSNKAISENLNHDNREVKIAAVTAARLKNDMVNAGVLIPVLQDPDPGVSAAAHEALKSLSGQDFGKSIDRWSRWLDTVNRKKP